MMEFLRLSCLLAYHMAVLSTFRNIYSTVVLRSSSSILVVLRSKVSIRIARACRSIFRTEQAVDRDAVRTRSLFGTLEESSLTP